MGAADYYRERYGEYPCGDTPRELAEFLHSRGFSIRDISIWVKLKYGKGCPSVVQRWLNEKSYQRHLENKRK